MISLLQLAVNFAAFSVIFSIFASIVEASTHLISSFVGCKIQRFSKAGRMQA